MAGTYRLVVDERDPATPFTITGENITPPAASSVGTANVYLAEVPKKDSPTSLTLKSGTTVFTEVTGSPGVTEFKPIYRSTNKERWMGMVQLHSTHAGKSGIFTVDYSGIGAPIIVQNLIDIKDQKLDSDAAAFREALRSGTTVTTRHSLNFVPGPNVGITFEDSPSKNQIDVILSTTIAGQTIVPSNAQYIVGGLNTELTGERLLTAGSGIRMVDAGANSTWTVSQPADSVNQRIEGLQSNTSKGTRPALNFIAGDVISHIRVSDNSGTNRLDILFSAGGNVAPTTSQYVTIGNSTDVSAERAITAGNLINITDGGAGGTLTIALNSTTAFRWMRRHEIDTDSVNSSSVDNAFTLIHSAGGTGFTIDTNGTLNTSLVAYWRLEETDGTRADSKGSNNLTDNNTVTSVAGKIGNAAEFVRANNEYLSIADNSDLSAGDVDFTITGWFYPISTAGIMASKRVAGDAGSEYYISLRGTGSLKVGFSVYSTAPAEEEVVTTGSAVLNAWNFFVASHDAVNNQLLVQLNNDTPNTLAYSAGVQDTTTAFQLGAFSGASAPSQFFNGYIDEVGFWKKVLSAQERADLYNSGNANTYPVTNRGLATGTPGIGTGILFQTRDSASNLDSISTVSFIHTKVTSASEDSDMTINLRSAGSGLLEWLRLSSSGLSAEGEILSIGDKNIGGKGRFITVYAADPPNPPVGEADFYALDSGAGARVFKVRYNDAGTIRVRHIALAA